MSRPHARGRRDDGFTLIELVVSVSILGVVAVALTGVVLSYLKTTVATQARFTESHDVQFAAAYWARDVGSIGVRSSVYDEATHSFPFAASVGVPPCGIPSGATEVVSLAWSEYSSLVSTDAPDTVTVTYYARSEGVVFALVRERCGAQPSEVVVARSLQTIPEVRCRGAQAAPMPCAGAELPSVIEMSLRIDDSEDNDALAYEAVLTGERRQS